MSIRLAGFYIVFDAIDSGNENDQSATALKPPSGIGDYDIPLAIGNPKFDASGLVIFNQFDTEGFIGNRITVNGKIQPYFRVATRKYRFRVLNASTARCYDLVLRAAANRRPRTKPAGKMSSCSTPRKACGYGYSSAISRASTS
jgi:FtsP/CotA-like multicopper oxidase with cupredoxin domain